MRSRSWLSAGLACVAFLNLGIAPFIVLGPVVASESLGGAKSWGLIAAVGALGGVLGGDGGAEGAPAAAARVVLPMWMLGALPLLALMPPLPALAIAVALAAFGFTSNLGNAIWETVMQREIAPELRSRVFSFDMLVSVCFVPLGQAAAGPVAAAAGTRATLFVGALLLVVPCAVALLVPSVRALEHDGAAVVPERLEAPLDAG